MEYKLNLLRFAASATIFVLPFKELLMSAERLLLKLRKVLDTYCYTQYCVIFLRSKLTLRWYFLACNSTRLQSSLIKKIGIM